MCLILCFFPNDVSPILNIFFLNILLITMTMAFSVLLTIFFNEITIHVFKRATRSTVLLSYALFWVVLSIMLQDSLSGISLKELYWYLTPGVWPMALTIVRVWLGAGYLSIIYLAAITSVPDDTYEVARIDGISTTRISWQMTRPLLIPTVIILLLAI